jgi:hypothetical protein
VLGLLVEIELIVQDAALISIAVTAKPATGR